MVRGGPETDRSAAEAWRPPKKGGHIQPLTCSYHMLTSFLDDPQGCWWSGQARGNGMHSEPENSKVITNIYSFLCWDAQDPDALPSFESSPMIGIVLTKLLAKPTTEAWITRLPKSSVSRLCSTTKACNPNLGSINLNANCTNIRRHSLPNTYRQPYNEICSSKQGSQRAPRASEKPQGLRAEPPR